MTDAGLKELAPLKNLTYAQPERHEGDGHGAEGTRTAQKPHPLDLRGTKVTDAGLKELAALKNLKDSA